MIFILCHMLFKSLEEFYTSNDMNVSKIVEDPSIRFIYEFFYNIYIFLVNEAKLLCLSQHRIDGCRWRRPITRYQ